MNRFELLELMYELVRENEKLRRKCERLEAGNADPEESTAYSYTARSRPAQEQEHYRYDEDEHYRTRREEVMQKMMEQTYQPAPSPARQTTPSRSPERKKTAAPVKPAAQPARSAAAQPAKQAVQPQPVRQAAPVKPQPQPKTREASPDDFNIDSILQEYLADVDSGENGGRV